MDQNLNKDNILIYLKDSPLRRIQSEELKDVFKEYFKILDDIDKILENNEKNNSDKLKIAIVGEIKAGKSTLVNALVQKDLSYTNVLEATSSILEINYGEDRALIQYKDSSLEELSDFKELNNIIDKNIDNREFFERIDKIKLYSRSDILKNISLVDTPGLSTVSEDNINRTYDYLSQVDIFFWVLNVHHMGQRDIIDQVNELVDFGKPLVCIINRVDELAGNLDELLEYMEVEAGYLFDEILYLSAKNALEGYRSNDLSMVEDSNIHKLKEYIEDNIGENIDNLAKEIEESSFKMQLQKDLELHKKFRNELGRFYQEIKEDLDELKKFNIEIKKDIDGKLDYWIENKLYTEERNMLAKGISGGISKTKIQEYFNEDYLSQLVEDEFLTLSNYLRKEWTYKEDFLRSKNRDYNIKDKYRVNSSLVAIESNKKEAYISKIDDNPIEADNNILGAGLAWLAAGSIANFSLPLGIFVAGIGGVFFKEEITNRKNRATLSLVDEAYINSKKYVQKNIYPILKKELDNFSNSIFEELLSNIDNILLDNQVSEEDISRLIEDLDLYIDKNYYANRPN